MKTLLFLLIICVLAACTPATEGAGGATEGASAVEFGLEPVPQNQRWRLAVPNFEVRSNTVRIGEADLEEQGDGFFNEIGAGVADIFVTEAFRSQQFVLTERAELEKVLGEQNLATSGRVSADTAAEVGRITGAEFLVLGSVSEFSVQTTGGGGKVLGIFGGSAETVTASVGVDIRVVDAVTAEIIAIGTGRDRQSQSNVSIDILNVIRGLQAGQSGNTIVDVAVRNAIRKAIIEAASTLPEKP